MENARSAQFELVAIHLYDATYPDDVVGGFDALPHEQSSYSAETFV